MEVNLLKNLKEEICFQLFCMKIIEKRNNVYEAAEEIFNE